MNCRHRGILLLLWLAAASAPTGSRGGESASGRPDKIAEVAATHWSLAFPGETPTFVRGGAYVVVGRSPADLQAVAEAADKLREKILRLWKLPEDESPESLAPTLIYALPVPYDYGEFGLMVEKRPLPGNMHGHWRQDQGLTYIVLGPSPAGDDFPSKFLLTRDLASTLVRGWGMVPDWYADGAGYAAVEIMHRRDPRLPALRSRAAEVLSTVDSTERLLSSDFPPEAGGLVHWAFVRFLLKDARRGSRFLRSLRGGADFESSFEATYGAKPEQVADYWLRRHGVGAKRKHVEH